jgi:hypothetical protein
MGQIIIVQGEAAEITAAVFRRALGVFESVTGLRPCAQASTGGARIAKFPRLCPPGSGITLGPSIAQNGRVA